MVKLKLNQQFAEWTNNLSGRSYTQGFDVENRVIIVTVSSGAPITTTFAYDATGQRTQTISYSSSTSRIVTRYPFPHYEVEHQQQWQYSCDNDPCGYMWVTTQTTPRTTYFLAGQAIATRVNGTLYYLHTDHLGSTSLMSNSSGYSVSGTTTRYLPYGERRTTPTTILTERGYTGHHENRNIGLTYMNARYYVPGLGRFLTADTLIPNPTNPQSHNRYSYVRGNPLRYTDPTGHDCYDPSSGNLFGTCTDGSLLPITPPPPEKSRQSAKREVKSGIPALIQNSAPFTILPFDPAAYTGGEIQGFGDTQFAFTSGLYSVFGYLHPGIDIPLPAGTPLYALGDGYVTCGAEELACGQQYDPTGQGHGIGIYYYACTCIVYYSHAINVLASQTNDQPTQVKAGDVVGYSGASPDGYEHLHLEIRNLTNTRVYNPLYFFEPTLWNSINPYYMAYQNNHPSPQTRMYEIAMSTEFNYWKWNGSYPLAVVR